MFGRVTGIESERSAAAGGPQTGWTASRNLRSVRVAQVCPYSLTVPGGVQSQVLGLARSLRRLGDDCRVLAPCDGPPPDAAVTALGRSVPTAANGSMAPIAPDPSAALRTIRALHDERFELVHIHEPLVPGPALTSLLVADGPIVATFHRSGRSLAYTALRPLVRYAARRIDLRVAVSDSARDTAQQALGGDHYEVLWNGIEVDRFAKAEPVETDGRPTIAFLGRHEPRKGLDVLLGAMTRLGPDVRLWVMGNGPQTGELQTSVVNDSRIVWLGQVGDAEVASRIAGADVFCAPSLHGESFGVVLLEAMAAQTPIVASDLPGYRRVVRPDQEAVVVPPGDEAALAAALAALLDDPTRARQMVTAGLARAEEFSMDALAQRYHDLYESALQGR